MKRRGFLGSICAMVLAVQVKLDVPVSKNYHIGVDPAAKDGCTLVWYDEHGVSCWALKNKEGKITHKEVKIDYPTRTGRARSIGNPRIVAVDLEYRHDNESKHTISV